MLWLGLTPYVEQAGKQLAPYAVDVIVVVLIV